MLGVKSRSVDSFFHFVPSRWDILFSRWDILDVPATKNVELYNPEMDESKPKSEVP